MSGRARYRRGGVAGRFLPPPLAEVTLDRPRLMERLDGALDRRLTTIVAGAGFGKSTLLASWSSRHPSAWLALTPDDRGLDGLARDLLDSLRLRVPALPGELAGFVAAAPGPDAAADAPSRARALASILGETLAAALPRDLVLVLDDLHEAEPGGSAARLIEALCRQAPATLHIVAASRVEVPFPIARLRGQGQVLELTATDLAFAPEETAGLLAAHLGDDEANLANAVHRATRGWPAAVRMAIEAFRGIEPPARAAAVERLAAPDSPVFAYLAEEVLGREQPAVLELLRLAAAFDQVSPELCEALGAANAATELARLGRRGLFLEPAGEGHHALSPLVRELVLEHFPLAEHDLDLLHRRAAAWFEANDRPAAALASLVRVDDHASIARLLEERGADLLAAGAVGLVAAAASDLPAELRMPAIDRVEGEARQVRGDWEGALACFERIAADRDDLDPGTAWRLGLIHHLRGHLDEALAIYQRGHAVAGEPRDEALLLAWTATAHWLRGDVEPCRDLTTQAHERAHAAGDDRALATVHTALAMLAALEGDRRANDAHYLRALDHAERAGDVLQQIRIRANRGSRFTEEGWYEEAVAELDAAIQLADLTGFASFRALALANRGEARFRLGRFEEAMIDLEASLALYQQLGSRAVAYPLSHMGEIHRERGDLALARAAYSEAIAVAEPEHDLQGMVPPLAGLARALADEDPDAAAELAQRARDAGSTLGKVEALLASGWVALHRGEREMAEQCAAEAAELAGGRRDRAGLAESLELRAASGDPARAAGRLHEAHAIWLELRSPLGQARAELALAQLDGSAAPERAERAERAEAIFRSLGARGHAAAASQVRAGLHAAAQVPVGIGALGGFSVTRDGVTVAATEWQSKKARDLLKVLVARRGHPTHRELLMELLWPDTDAERASSRLSVVLSTARSVLDPDKRYDPDYFLASDRTTVRLDLTHVAVDIEAFLEHAEAGLDLLRRDDRAAAATRLAVAEATYAGDFLEEDAYDDWAVPLREQCRTAYIDVARALAAIAAGADDHDAAVRYLLRVLERDPYDERAHLTLVSSLSAAGRHGEARRAYRAYCDRMEELDIESAPFPVA